MKLFLILLVFFSNLCFAQTPKPVDLEFGFHDIKIGTYIGDYPGFYNPIVEHYFIGLENIYYPPDEKKYKIGEYPVELRVLTDKDKKVRELTVTFIGYQRNEVFIELKNRYGQPDAEDYDCYTWIGSKIHLRLQKHNRVFVISEAKF